MHVRAEEVGELVEIGRIERPADPVGDGGRREGCLQWGSVGALVAVCVLAHCRTIKPLR